MKTLKEDKAIFQTERLEVREMNQSDLKHYITLRTDPNIIDLIPQKVEPNAHLIETFNQFTSYIEPPEVANTTVWGIYEKGNTELIGLCGYLTNDEQNPELGYRFRKEFWRKGYGTEVTESMIDHCFRNYNIDVLTADVWVKNYGSIKILDKYFKAVREFKNEEDQCIDRRYHLTREDWLKLKQND